MRWPECWRSRCCRARFRLVAARELPPIQAYERGTIRSAARVLHHATSAGWPKAAELGDHDLAGRAGRAHRGKPALSLVLGPRSRRRTAPPHRPGCSRSTGRRPRDRRQPDARGQHQEWHRGVRRRVRDGVGRQEHGAQQERGLRLRPLHPLPATAISFQVILIVGHANVIVPQNISAAANYNCISCVTQRLRCNWSSHCPASPAPPRPKRSTCYGARSKLSVRSRGDVLQRHLCAPDRL